MNRADMLFINLMEELLESENSTIGEKVRPVYTDGTPANTCFLTHKLFQYDLSKDQFPLLTLRPLAWKSAINEILWIYQDQTSDLKPLEDRGIKWWEPWNIGDKTIGNRYGHTVKKYDLINNLIKGLKEQPYGRRHIMDLYQYEEFLTSDGLHPCAFLTMWSVRGEYLDMSLVQRSSDFIVAGNINQIQYVALQMMIAKTVGLKPGKFSHYIENVHIYDRHFENAEKMLRRMPTEKTPKLILNTDNTDFYKFSLDDFIVEDYTPCGDQLKFELGI